MTILLQPTTVPTLVFLGRNDRTRKSDLIAGIARRLGDQGCTLHWFRSDPPEPYRTRPLARVPRPLLVLQGSRDIYGSDPSSIIRLLPASGKLVMLACDHDYDRVAPAEFDKVWCAVCDFLSETR